MVGQILRINSGYYDIDFLGKEYRVRASGNLRNENHKPLVGDFVDFQINGMITKIELRKNEFLRPKVSNVDIVVIVVSFVSPNFSSYLLNKMLAIVEFKKIKPIILFTKLDLIVKNDKLTFFEEYKSQGYEALLIDSGNDWLVKITSLLSDKLAVFMGQTGVGKTTIINKLTNTNRKTQEISKALGRGKHTTRIVEILKYEKFKIIDTPGFSSFKINLSKSELSTSFNDFSNLSKKCKFNSCLHLKEDIDICEIKSAVKNNIISKTRYDDYVKMIKEIENE